MHSDRVPLVYKTDERCLVENDQLPGIGRLASLNNLLVINNLGRNIELCRKSENGFTQVGYFNNTRYLHDAYMSEFDLDFHAFLSGPSQGDLIAINHLGDVRLFDTLHLEHSGSGSRALLPKHQCKWIGDIERMLVVDNCLVGSSPRGHEVKEPRAPGLFVSQPLDEIASWESDVITYHTHLADWGMITAIAVNEKASLIAVAVGSKIGVFKLERHRQHGPKPADMLWQRVFSEYAVSWLSFNEEDNTLIVAGSDSQFTAANDHEWEKMSGGGWTSCDVETGDERIRGTFNITLGWGNGGVPIVLLPDSQRLAAADRNGGLHTWSLKDGLHKEVFQSADNQQEPAIIHMTVLDGALVYGFNRGGYVLYSYPIEQLQTSAGGCKNG